MDDRRSVAGSVLLVVAATVALYLALFFIGGRFFNQGTPNGLGG